VEFDRDGLVSNNEDTEIELRRYLYPDLQGPGEQNVVKDEHPYDASKETLEQDEDMSSIFGLGQAGKEIIIEDDKRTRKKRLQK